MTLRVLNDLFSSFQLILMLILNIVKFLNRGLLLYSGCYRVESSQNFDKLFIV